MVFDHVAVQSNTLDKKYKLTNGARPALPLSLSPRISLVHYSFWLESLSLSALSLALAVASLSQMRMGFAAGPLAIGALGNKLEGHAQGGVEYKNVVVKDDKKRPVLVVDGSGSTSGLGGISGSIEVHNSAGEGTGPGGGCSIAGGGFGFSGGDSAVLAALAANVSLHCK